MPAPMLSAWLGGGRVNRRAPASFNSAVTSALFPKLPARCTCATFLSWTQPSYQQQFQQRLSMHRCGINVQFSKARAHNLFSIIQSKPAKIMPGSRAAAGSALRLAGGPGCMRLHCQVSRAAPHTPPLGRACRPPNWPPPSQRQQPTLHSRCLSSISASACIHARAFSSSI